MANSSSDFPNDDNISFGSSDVITDFSDLTRGLLDENILSGPGEMQHASDDANFDISNGHQGQLPSQPDPNSMVPDLRGLTPYGGRPGAIPLTPAPQFMQHTGILPSGAPLYPLMATPAAGYYHQDIHMPQATQFNADDDIIAEYFQNPAQSSNNYGPSAPMEVVPLTPSSSRQYARQEVVPFRSNTAQSVAIKDANNAAEDDDIYEMNHWFEKVDEANQYLRRRPFEECTQLEIQGTDDFQQYRGAALRKVCADLFLALQKEPSLAPKTLKPVEQEYYNENSQKSWSQVKGFFNSAAQRKYVSARVRNAVDEIIAIHTHGFPTKVLEKANGSRIYPVEQVKCSERINLVLRAAKQSKNVALDIIRGDNISQIAESPKLYLGRKVANAVGNCSRSAKANKNRSTKSKGKAGAQGRWVAKKPKHKLEDSSDETVSEGDDDASSVGDNQQTQQDQEESGQSQGDWDFIYNHGDDLQVAQPRQSQPPVQHSYANNAPSFMGQQQQQPPLTFPEGFTNQGLNGQNLPQQPATKNSRRRSRAEWDDDDYVPSGNNKKARR